MASRPGSALRRPPQRRSYGTSAAGLVNGVRAVLTRENMTKPANLSITIASLALVSSVVVINVENWEEFRAPNWVDHSRTFDRCFNLAAEDLGLEVRARELED